MKIHNAIVLTDLPKGIIKSERISALYGYNIWRFDVKEMVEECEEEVVRFRKFRDEGVCDKVGEVIDCLEENRKLLEFMEINKIDVIFADLESESRNGN